MANKAKKKLKAKTAKKANGRPTTFSEELGDLICVLMAEGKSLNKICSLDDMPHKSTVFLWVVKGDRGDALYKGFSDQFKRAREAQAESYMDENIDISDDDKNDFGFIDTETSEGKGARPCIRPDNINRAKLRIETRFKVASRFHPKKYGEKLQLGGDAENPEPIKTSLKVVFVDSAGDSEVSQET